MIREETIVTLIPATIRLVGTWLGISRALHAQGQLRKVYVQRRRLVSVQFKAMERHFIKRRVAIAVRGPWHS